MRGSRFARRGKITLVNVVALIGLLLFAAALLLPAMCDSRETDRQNRCRSNLKTLAMAAVRYDGRNGKYPGYMNVLIRHDGTPYVDPATNAVVPVSWVVELLSDLEQVAIYDDWRRPATIERALGESTSSKAPRPDPKVYLEFLICPSDVNRRSHGTPLSYVANSGMPDLPQSIPASAGAAGLPSTIGMPRDWQANGMFFDNFSDDRLIKTNSSQRGPMVVMRSGQVRDAKDKTIFITESLDATSYVFDSHDYPDSNPALTEIAWGSNYMPGAISTVAGGTASETYEMQPSDTVLAPNAGREGAPHPFAYKYCRPSSMHPEGFNVAFVGSNVVFMRDTISYYVFAKLMASDDLAMKLPGSQKLVDPRLRGYQISQVDLNP